MEEYVTNFISGDYTHLTEEGYKLMADKIMKALLEQG